jgi:hypothetical protein
MTTSRTLAAAAALALVTPACDSHDHDHSLGHDACEHYVDGPVVDVTAGADAATAAEASAAHTRLDVTLVDVSGAPGGFLSVAITEAGAHGFFFDAPVSLVVTNAGGSELIPTASGTTDADCAEVASWFTFDLAVGTYVFALSAEAGTTDVSLVHAYSDDDHGH